jgi:hypothetical protein
MIIGLDFDNTIVCYDELFHRAAISQGLIPPALATDKNSVRDYLRGAGREDDWTRLQGHVYGKAILEAKPFAGIHEFLNHCHLRNIGIYVVSHKTRYPVLGERHDLHRAASEWLEINGFFDTAQTGLSPVRVNFELTKDAKLSRIGALGCTDFVDDLPEFLLEASFPAGVRRILFDPARSGGVIAGLERARSWQEIAARVLSIEAAPAR